MAREKSKPITYKANEATRSASPLKYNPFGNTSNASMWSKEMSSGRFTENVAEGSKIAKDISKGSYDMKMADPSAPQHSKPGSQAFIDLLSNMQ